MTYVIALDGGGSKTDAVAIALDGTILGRASAATSSPHFIGLGPSVAVVAGLVDELLQAGPPAHVGIYLSGLDLEREVADYRAALAGFAWAGSITVENDLFALLRAGSSAPDAAAVICGTGLNALAIRGDGEVARYLALGPISGDWGGGGGIGELALWHSARETDGRGEHTSLTVAIPREFGLQTVTELTLALHDGTYTLPDLARLSPVVLEHSRAGDPVARRIVERQAEEIAVMAAAALTRLGLHDDAVPVVLGGGVVQSGDRLLLEGVDAALARLAPRAYAVIVDAAPILGAGLLALESAGATGEAVERARTGLG